MENKPQDAVSIAPHLHKVVLENEKVRILDVVVKPGDRAEMHTHPSNVSVVLKGGTLKFTLPDGTIKEVKLENNFVGFSNPSQHIVDNESTEEVRVIQIELK